MACVALPRRVDSIAVSFLCWRALPADEGGDWGWRLPAREEAGLESTLAFPFPPPKSFNDIWGPRRAGSIMSVYGVGLSYRVGCWRGSSKDGHQRFRGRVNGLGECGVGVTFLDSGEGESSCLAVVATVAAVAVALVSLLLLANSACCWWG